MSIKKPLGLGLVIGLLAMAFAALPAMASAAQLTDPAGSVEVGETITGESGNAVTTVPGVGELRCVSVVVNGIVTKNSGGDVQVAMDGAGDTATGCTIAGKGTLVSPTLTSISLSGATGSAVFDFTVATEKGPCPASSTSGVSWTSGTSSLHVEGPVLPGAEGCPGGLFHGDFTLSDANGAVTVD